MLVLITGGSKNGKSSIAENILTAFPVSRFYIATMQPFGSEAMEAINRHRKMRKNKNFQTIEKYTDIGEISLPSKCGILLECICNLCANEMFSAGNKTPSAKILDDISKLNKQAEIFTIVTNQVGSDGMAYPDETMRYMEQTGIINNGLARMADTVIEAVFGIPVLLKGEMPLCL